MKNKTTFCRVRGYFFHNFYAKKSLCTVVVQHHIRNNNSKGVMNSKVPKYSTISTNIWAELLHEIDRQQRRQRRRA